MASSETWAKRITAWRASGQTAAAFAAGRGFAGSTLRWWASHLGRRRGAALVRVVPAVAVPRDAAIELEIGGVRVVVRAGFDRVLLREVLDVLRERSAS